MSNLKIIISFFFVILLVSACKDKTKEVVPGPGLIARAGADQQVVLGQTVTLDGSNSSESQNKPFEFSWVLLKKPTGSAVTLGTATTAKASFIPDEEGEYEAELTISNAEGESKDKVIITAAAAEPETINSNITAKTVLINRIANPNLPDYVITKNINVDAELTINPGVVIAFSRDAKLTVSNKGSLIAKGEAGKPIRFEGREKTSGFWSGIQFSSPSGGNSLEYVEVMHAGASNLTGNIKAGMAILGNTSAQISIKNSSFQHNKGYGLYIGDGTTLLGFANNTFKDNTEAGITLNANNVKHLDVESIFTGGNGRNVVEIFASKLEESVSYEISWPVIEDGTPFMILSSLTINAAWKVLPGTIIELGRDATIRVEQGYMNASGTADNKIIIRGVETNVGYWRGILFSTPSLNNIISHADISGGGSQVMVSGKKANVSVQGTSSRINVNNCNISKSSGYGIFVAYHTQTNDNIATENTFTDNSQGSIFIER